MIQTTNLSLQIGEYQICPIPTGIFGLDGGSMFGTVPKVLWEKAIPADDKNRIPMEARALLLKGTKRNILIDTGNGSDFVAKYGDKLGSKFAEMYNIDDNGPSLLKSLKIHNINPDDITDVILTHLHFDHAGGAVKSKDGNLVPAFSNATYYIQKANLETAQNPNIREKASYFKSNFEPLQKANKLQIVPGNTENLIPGISVLISNGHTLGHQMVRITDGKTTLLYCGDVVPTSAHVRLAWVMGYDLEPLKLIHEKENILGIAADGDWYLYFEHDPYCDAAQINRNGADFAVKARYNLGAPAK